jgi:hypothetical protein
MPVYCILLKGSILLEFFMVFFVEIGSGNWCMHGASHRSARKKYSQTGFRTLTMALFSILFFFLSCNFGTEYK